MAIDTYTKLLLHCNGTDGATTFTDSETTPKTITAVGTAQIDTAQKKFGTASGLFDGNSDYLTIPDSADWYFGSGDWTIDLWARLVDGTTGAGSFCSQVTNNYNFFMFGYGLAGLKRLYFKIRSGDVDVVSLTSDDDVLTDNAWYHIALVHSGTTYTFYVNGVSDNSTTDADNAPDFTGTFNIGYSQSETPAYYYLNGWIDEFRVSKGIARWTANFTPPSAEYGDDFCGGIL